MFLYETRATAMDADTDAARRGENSPGRRESDARGERGGWAQDIKQTSRGQRATWSRARESEEGG